MLVKLFLLACNWLGAPASAAEPPSPPASALEAASSAQVPVDEAWKKIGRAHV